MNELINALQISLETNNHYGALFMALTVPDICGKIENPELSSKKRYIKWFDNYLSIYYTKKIGAEQKEHIFLTGYDLYALRCAILHEYNGDITNQSVRKVLNNFAFSTTLSHCLFVTNNSNDKKTLILRIDVFCKEIINAVKNWLTDIEHNELVQERLKLSFKIHHDSSFKIS